MNDFQKFVQRRDPAPYEEIRVNPIEKNKKDKEEPYKGFPISGNKSLLFSSVISCFKKLLGFFFGKSKSLPSYSNEQQLLKDVAAFKRLLEMLTQNDQSHNPEYTQELSRLWHNLIDDCNFILANSTAKSDNLINLKIFIDEVHRYPPDEDHTLGYYFTEYAGRDWIPFPFMEILQHLYKESHESPQKATLVKWLDTLAHVLSNAGYKNPA